MLPIVQNCTRIGCPSQDDWSQYGQGFINIGDQPRIFLVEPFKLGQKYSGEHNMKPLCINQQVWHFFKKWLDGGIIETYWLENIGTRIQDERFKDYFHILSYGTNPRETVMEGYNEPGFKYRVEYIDGLWTCTCKHFHILGANVCCKHINACIGVATSTARLGWPLERSQFVFDDTYSEEHIGLCDIVVEIMPDSVESGSDMDLSSDDEFDMVPVFKHWLA